MGGLNPIDLIPAAFIDKAREAMARPGGAYVDSREGRFLLPGPPWWSYPENPHYVRPNGTVRPTP